LLVKIKRDLENQIRGLLKNVGLVIGRAKFNVFAVRAEELIEDRPELIAVIGPLLKARKAIEQQTDDLDREVLKLARPDLGGRWPSGLVATAAENCLNAPAQSAHAVWGSDADQIHGPNADPY
jgi:hypothetical protein